MATFSQPRTDTDPSALETQLAQATLDPRTAAAALPLLVGYGAERSMSNSTSQAYGNLVLQLQRQQAGAENAAKSAGLVNDFLKLVNDNPGAVDAGTSNPYLSPYLQGTDFASAAQTAEQNLRAKRLMEAGRGAGAMGMAGINIEPGYLSSVLGPGASVSQGTPPLVQAAQVRAGGDRSSVTLTVPTSEPGGQYSIKGPNVDTVNAAAAKVPNPLGSKLDTTKPAPAKPTGSSKPATATVPTRPATAQELARIPSDIREQAQAARGRLEVYQKPDGTKYLMGQGTQGWLIQ